MIPETSSLDNATILLRQSLIRNSGLDSERVLNSLSLTGTELDELLEDSIYNSIDHDNNTLLFEISPETSTSDMHEESLNDSATLIYYKVYSCHIIIYGNDSNILALELASRLMSNEVQNELYTEGIYVSDVSHPQSFNEFKNNSMWLRNDITVTFGLRYTISKIVEDNDYETINTLYTEEV